MIPDPASNSIAHTAYDDLQKSTTPGREQTGEMWAPEELSTGYMLSTRFPQNQDSAGGRHERVQASGSPPAIRVKLGKLLNFPKTVFLE